MRVLVVNAGSSTLKLVLLGPEDQRIAERTLPTPGGSVDEREVRAALAGGLAKADAVAHRVVHGGERFRGAVLMDASVEEELRTMTELAPLHQAKSLAALDAVSTVLPHLPAVACFDTSFHSRLPPAAQTYALPEEWRTRWRVRRFGFHGLSHAWVARRVPELLHRPRERLSIISCHLGAGASVCAIAAGRSINTSMGFTPLEGLVMATRSGSVDPGLVLWLLEHTGMSPGEVARSLEHESGLVGLTGTADMAVVLDRSTSGDRRAQLGLDVYLHRLRSEIGAMAATLGGVDAVAFTGGVGENSAEIRRRAIQGLGFLGLVLNEPANERASGDTDLSAAGASASSLLIRAREDLEMARQARTLLGARRERQLSA